MIAVPLLRRPLLAGVALILVLLTACGGQDQGRSASPGPAPTAPAPAVSSPAPPPAAPPAPVALVARTATELAVFTAPGAPAPATTLSATTEFGSARALLVVDRQGDWLEVALPSRPNGSTGWVRTADVALREVAEAVHVDLAARELVLTVAGEVVLRSPVAIGAPDAPTPTGAFYVVDKLASPNPDGAYGPFALGLSGHSEVLTEFGGGDGQVGIHGTSDPSSIGQAVSHGCVRVPNDVVTLLSERLPLGTPVTIA